MDSMLPPASALRVALRDMKSSYRKRCRDESRHMCTCSYFLGICCATSALSRRITNGRSTACRRATSDLSTLGPPSTCAVSGLENHCLNSAWERNRCGMRKCMSDHSSMSEFCSGVPVSSSRRRVAKDSSVCQRADW